MKERKKEGGGGGGGENKFCTWTMGTTQLICHARVLLLCGGHAVGTARSHCLEVWRLLREGGDCELWKVPSGLQLGRVGRVIHRVVSWLLASSLSPYWGLFIKWSQCSGWEPFGLEFSLFSFFVNLILLQNKALHRCISNSFLNNHLGQNFCLCNLLCE